MPDEQVNDAIKSAVRMQPSGVNSISTHLSENLAELTEAAQIYAYYLKVLERIKGTGIIGKILKRPT